MIPGLDSGFSPQLAMDARGNAFVVWYQFDGRSFGVWAARFSKASGWERLDVINSPASVIGDDSIDPKIRFDGAGNAVAVWRKFEFRLNTTVVRANCFDARTGWGMDETISARPGVAVILELAVSATGFATATWWSVENNLVTPQSVTAQRTLEGPEHDIHAAARATQPHPPSAGRRTGFSAAPPGPGPRAAAPGLRAAFPAPRAPGPSPPCGPAWAR